MKISYNWLQSHIVEPLPPADELAEKIIFGAFEVENHGDLEKLPNGDVMLDIKVLPDRAHDCLSHQGIAREVAGLLGLTVKDVSTMYKVPESIPTHLEIDVQTGLCRRYMGRIIRNVTIAPSPQWMVDFLTAIGQRSINNIVDATNIVMYDCGQPTHAFDAKKLASEKITIKQLEHDANFTTLSDEEKILVSGDMVITDDAALLAIAGVKGGKQAEVDDQTTDIVIEVANFDPVAVRKTSRRLNILTDSAKRFENELSPEKAAFAMQELSALIAELCPGAVFEDVVDFYPKPVEQRTVVFTAAYISKKLGTVITSESIETILKKYTYSFTRDGDSFIVTIPFDRIDITGPHDMVEEIGRAYGYDHIPVDLVSINRQPEINHQFAQIAAIKADLGTKGYWEVMNYSFGKKGDFEVVRGPIGKSALRTNLTNTLKESYEKNAYQKDLMGISGELKLFEVGTVFSKDGEEIHVAFADKKGIKEMQLAEYISEYQIDLPVASYTLSHATHLNSFKQWSEYPFITRDIAVWVPASTTPESVLQVIRDSGGELLIREPYLFDTFSKDGRTSVAFRMIFQSYDRTLTEAEITPIMEKITEKMKENNWEVR